MSFSKIILNGTTLMDLTSDTVGENNLLLDYTAHEASGDLIIGEATGDIILSITQDQNGYLVLDDDGTEVTDGYKYVRAANNFRIYYPRNRELWYSWDLTQSLTDTVSGATITLSGSATQDSTGIHLTTVSDCAMLPFYYRPHMTYEFDFGTVSWGGTTAHGRLLMFANDTGLIFRSGSSWDVYLNNGGWNGSSPSSDSTILSNKTLTVKSGDTSLNYYLNGNLWYAPVKTSQSVVNNDKMRIGSAGGQSFYNATVTGIRVYWGGV